MQKEWFLLTEWTARSVNEDIIPENTLVEVVAIEGVKAIVKIKK